MKRILFVSYFLLSISFLTRAQDVFDPGDPIVRYKSSQPLGSREHPNPDKPGLQKWVSVPSPGVSTGSSTYNSTSFKQYFINVNGGQNGLPFEIPQKLHRQRR